MITVGIVIGAGLFQTPALVAGNTASPAMMLLAWTLGGALSFVGALTYAELSAARPSAGGDYTFLRLAFGRNLSFLFAWARSLVICTGSIALLGFILGDYLSYLLPIGPASSAVYAALAVLALTAINLAGLRYSSRMQTVLTLIEVGGVLLVAFAGFSLDAAAPLVADARAESAGSGAFGLAMVFVLLTYGGWNEAAYVSAEVHGGPRAIVRTLLLSLAIITGVYLLFVASLLHGLGFEALRTGAAVGVDVVERALGPAGARLLAAIVAIAALTSMNSTMIVGARSNYAVAQDWALLGFMRRWQGEHSVPGIGFLVQAVIALALIGFGATQRDGFTAMVEFTAPVFWLFFTLSGLALFVLRYREPQAPRPVKVPLYPLLPAIFVLTCVYLLHASVVHAQSQHAGYVALAVMASGVIALLVLRACSRPSSPPGPVA
jgi:amino acid transporter